MLNYTTKLDNSILSLALAPVPIKIFGFDFSITNALLIYIIALLLCSGTLYFFRGLYYGSYMKPREILGFFKKMFAFFCSLFFLLGIRIIFPFRIIFLMLYYKIKKKKRSNNNYLFAFVANHSIYYPTPISLTYAWSFGFLAGMCLLTQMISGIFLAMHYTPHVDLAFSSVEYIMRDVPNGWFLRYVHANGASMFFIVVYSHIFRGLYYGSYMKPREILGYSGVILFVLMMATAFTGYVLPWGQMSFWGATVITSMFTAIPVAGKALVEWLWGGFTVNNSTLNRFFSIHFILPFLIAGVTLIHLALLHKDGSNNPLGFDSGIDDVPFFPYFVFFKKMFAFFCFMFFLLGTIFMFGFCNTDPLSDFNDFFMKIWSGLSLPNIIKFLFIVRTFLILLQRIGVIPSQRYKNRTTVIGNGSMMIDPGSFTSLTTNPNLYNNHPRLYKHPYGMSDRYGFRPDVEELPDLPPGPPIVIRDYNSVYWAVHNWSTSDSSEHRRWYNCLDQELCIDNEIDQCVVILTYNYLLPYFTAMGWEEPHLRSVVNATKFILLYEINFIDPENCYIDSLSNMREVVPYIPPRIPLVDFDFNTMAALGVSRSSLRAYETSGIFNGTFPVVSYDLEIDHLRSSDSEES